jgi:hypothetical protein
MTRRFNMLDYDGMEQSVRLASFESLKNVDSLREVEPRGDRLPTPTILWS